MEQVTKSIAYIVYAIASADHKVSSEEKKAVHDFVNENWKTLSDKEDPFGVRALDFIDKLITSLENQKISSESSFELFHKIYDENKKDFTLEIKRFLVNISIKTGASFNRMNKSELVMLSRLEIILKG